MLFKNDQTAVIDQMIKAAKSYLAHVVGSETQPKLCGEGDLNC